MFQLLLKNKYKGNLEVQILDGFFDSDEQILNKISGSDYVGFSGTTPQVPHIKKLSKLVKKEYPSMKTIAGGYGPSLQPFTFLNDSTIDYLIVGEGEQSMLDILNGVTTEKLVSNKPIMGY